MANVKKAKPAWQIEAATVGQYGVTDIECGEVVIRCRTPRTVVRSVNGIDQSQSIDDKRMRLANRSTLVLTGNSTTHVPMDTLRTIAKTLFPAAKGRYVNAEGKAVEVVVSSFLDEFHAACIAARKEFGTGIEGGRYVADTE